MGGDVWLDEGSGADLKEIPGLKSPTGATFRFKVTLDAYNPSKWKASDFVPLPTLLPTSSDLLIGVVDDHELDRQSLVKQLQDLGLPRYQLLVFDSLTSFLESSLSVHGIVLDLRTFVTCNDLQALRRILKHGVPARTMLLCTPLLQKLYRKQLRLPKSTEATIVMRPPKLSTLANYINRLPHETFSPETLRDFIRGSSEKGGAVAAMDAVDVVQETEFEHVATTAPVLARSETSPSHSIEGKSAASSPGLLHEESYSSDSSVPTMTTPAGTPRAGLEGTFTPKESRAHHRTNDYFSLPLKGKQTLAAAAAAAATKTGEPEPEASQGRKAPERPDIFVETKLGQVKLPSFSVLVVEDNLINRQVTGRLLQRLGQRYEFAVDGQDAIEKVKEAVAANQLFDVILMDISMPVKDGFAATREIRELVGNSIWICGLSGNAFAEDRVRARESGMNWFLAKPARLSDIKDALGKYVQQVSVV